MREFASARSPFYARFHRGLEGRPLRELPVLTKAELMANFGLRGVFLWDMAEWATVLASYARASRPPFPGEGEVAFTAPQGSVPYQAWRHSAS